MQLKICHIVFNTCGDPKVTQYRFDPNRNIVTDMGKNEFEVKELDDLNKAVAHIKEAVESLEAKLTDPTPRELSLKKLQESL